MKKAAAFIVRLTVAGVGDGAGVGGAAGAAATAASVGAATGTAVGASAGMAVGAAGTGAAQALANNAAVIAGPSRPRAVHSMNEFPPATRAGFYDS